jgi:hypothetical protein
VEFLLRGGRKVEGMELTWGMVKKKRCQSLRWKNSNFHSGLFAGRGFSFLTVSFFPFKEEEGSIYVFESVWTSVGS